MSLDDHQLLFLRMLVRGMLGAGLCIYTMMGLPTHAWERFGLWLVAGLAIYFAYGYRHSTLRCGVKPVPLDPPPPIEK